MRESINVPAAEAVEGRAVSGASSEAVATFQQWDSVTLLTRLADGTTIWSVEGDDARFGGIGERRDDGSYGIAGCTVLATWGPSKFGQRLTVRTKHGAEADIWERFAVLEGRRPLIPVSTWSGLASMAHDLLIAPWRSRVGGGFFAADGKPESEEPRVVFQVGAYDKTFAIALPIDVAESHGREFIETAQRLRGGNA